jgi:hypothetical protein
LREGSSRKEERKRGGVREREKERERERKKKSGVFVQAQLYALVIAFAPPLNK